MQRTKLMLAAGLALRHNSNTAVAFHSGGDPRCRAQDASLRLDIPASRAFYGDYLQLP